jgi:UPF0716 protein FxsA
MALIVLLLFIGVPIAEIAVFIEIGETLGLWPTIAIVIATAIAGSALLRWQGLQTLYRAQESLRQDQFPLAEIFDGLCLILAGTLLLTPGFITDSLGLLLFFPPFRMVFRRFVVHTLTTHGNVHVDMRGGGPTAGGAPVIDGEFDEVRSQDEQGPSALTPPDGPRG